MLALCAVSCGADRGVELAAFGNARSEWLTGFLERPPGRPSDDTVGRGFARVLAVAVQRGFARWMQAVCTMTPGPVRAIEGKTVRRSYERGSGKAASPRVRAWANAQRRVRGQVTTAAQAPAMTASPALLQLLEVQGCSVTLDALGWQRALAPPPASPRGEPLCGR